MRKVKAARKRTTATILTAALLASAQLYGGRMAAAQPLTAIKVGISDPVNTVLAMWMADAAGFYKTYGIDAEIKSTNGGSRGAAMIQSGDIQVMHVGLSSVVKIDNSGGDIRLIGSLSNVIRFTFFSAQGVTTPADLKGGIVAVSSFGSESDATVTMALKKLGLTRADVVPKEFGGGRNRMAALKNGEARATSVNEPTATLAREQGVHVMADLVADHIPWLFSGVVVKADYLAAHRDLMKNFLKATIEGNYLALSDEKRAKEIITKELKITNPKIIDITYQDFKAQSPQNLEPTKPAIDGILNNMGKPLSSAGKYVDTSLLDELKTEGFFGAMQKKYNVH